MNNRFSATHHHHALLYASWYLAGEVGTPLEQNKHINKELILVIRVIVFVDKGDNVDYCLSIRSGNPYVAGTRARSGRLNCLTTWQASFLRPGFGREAQGAGLNFHSLAMMRGNPADAGDELSNPSDSCRKESLASIQLGLLRIFTTHFNTRLEILQGRSQVVFNSTKTPASHHYGSTIIKGSGRPDRKPNKVSSTKPTQETSIVDNPSTLNLQPDKAPTSVNALVNTTIHPARRPQLKLIQMKQPDKYGYGYVYKALQITDQTLFEVKVYSFNQLDTKQNRKAKRNCREWKGRRRFLDSWKENGLVFLILQYPKSRDTSSPVSSGPQGEEQFPSLVPAPPITKALPQKSDITKPQCVPYSRSPKEKTEKQKEKSRRYQQQKRQMKRAQRRRVSKSTTISNSSNAQQPSDADSFSPSSQLSQWLAEAFGFA
ncbi:hypothetical protein G7Y89_g15837 [Cudoniella acicularis]|uniref:Uncharacterized protein n=1 Tax=Cudoniella acicularis TaxID=354080 RepID=A0A8H4QEY8_9HELO|nr:hypothetical protein G7Y89_g15837 [Cudoniella acicularis]